jgi:hypothetical protein
VDAGGGSRGGVQQIVGVRVFLAKGGGDQTHLFLGKRWEKEMRKFSAACHFRRVVDCTMHDNERHTVAELSSESLADRLLQITDQVGERFERSRVQRMGLAADGACFHIDGVWQVGIRPVVYNVSKKRGLKRLEIIAEENGGSAKRCDAALDLPAL